MTTADLLATAFVVVVLVTIATTDDWILERIRGFFSRTEGR
jgi:hypothetical protein